ncbi:GatB/YqeY domain-containing protein [Amaricoccus sp.]|uniref:GatB/YqeY domain-containing protein n=1 Tax=Amaricoccus sp. TaxID=1872485 RepID=UPI001B6F14AC|nr:GatB/YqeY domain-containing protein [Amaricoccus sp.]MBP7000298.1 GatB/YqeY domain-containing protein [Amaricoccus sp.]
MLRERLSADLKDAIKAKDAARVSTLRLIVAAIKDRDIAARSEEGPDGVPDSEILAILARMIRQRQESAKAYGEGGRVDLVDQELAEIRIIKDYLPRQMSEDEVRAAVGKAIAATGASSIRDMGKVMAELKARHTGKMDFARASAAVKESFGG